MDASAWDARYRDSDLVWGVEPNRFVRSFCERLPVGEAMDVACGEGRNAFWLARLGWRVTGVDFSTVAIARARAHSAQLPRLLALRLRWRAADVTRLTLRPASLDLAVVSYLHLPPEQRDPLLVRLAAALRPSGHLVLVGHDVRNLAEGVSGPQDPVLLYQPDQLRSLVQSAGLTVEVARTAERPTADGIALDAVLRARCD